MWCSWVYFKSSVFVLCIISYLLKIFILLYIALCVAIGSCAVQTNSDNSVQVCTSFWVALVFGVCVSHWSTYPGTQRFSHSLTSVRWKGKMWENLWVHTRGPLNMPIRSEAVIKVSESDFEDFKGPNVCTQRFSRVWLCLFTLCSSVSTSDFQVLTSMGDRDKSPHRLVLKQMHWPFALHAFVVVGLLIRGFEMQMCCRLMWDANIEQDVTFHKLM